MYEEGRGVDRDDSIAVRWYSKAASKGHPFAILSIAYCFQHGIGTVANIEIANKLYSKFDETTKAKWRKERGMD